MIQFLQKYDEGDDFDIVNFPYLEAYVPRRPSYGVYIQCIYLNSFALPEHLLMLMTSIIVTNS